MTLHAKMTMVNLQRYYYNRCLNRYEIKYPCFCFFKPIFFSFRFLTYKKQWRNYKKNDAISRILIRIRFKRYCCKSGIAIFTWRATWNYTYIRQKTYLDWLFEIGQKRRSIESMLWPYFLSPLATTAHLPQITLVSFH